MADLLRAGRRAQPVEQIRLAFPWGRRGMEANEVGSRKGTAIQVVGQACPQAIRRDLRAMAW